MKNNGKLFLIMLIAMITLLAHPITSLSAEIKEVEVIYGDTIFTKVTLEGFEEGGIIAAVLMNGDIVCQELTAEATECIEFQFDADSQGNSVEILWLDSMKTLKPLCESKRVYIQDKECTDIKDMKNILTNLLVDKSTYVYPSNFVPQNALNVENGGIQLSLEDNVISVSGKPTYSKGHRYICFEEKLFLPKGRYYIQIWDVDGDSDGLVGGYCNSRRVLSNNENGSVPFVLEEDTEVEFGVDVYYNFETSTTFKMTVSTTVLEEYEETYDPYVVFEDYQIKDTALSDRVIKNGNTLYGKKWAVCGDSFTHGDFRNSLNSDNLIEDGIYVGKNKVYGYLIGNRNNMEIQHLAMGGMTMATPADGSFTNCFSNELYKSIDADVDYITLYFGINDSHHRPNSNASDGENENGIIELGTIDDNDTSTFYGAWNVVLEYLIKNYPKAHIGIIVSNGCETSDYPEAEIKLAEKWGIPYIDLNGDSRTPAMIRSTNSKMSDAAKLIKNQSQAVNWGVNNHPSATTHEYQSAFIENWLRGL